MSIIMEIRRNYFIFLDCFLSEWYNEKKQEWESKQWHMALFVDFHKNIDIQSHIIMGYSQPIRNS